MSLTMAIYSSDRPCERACSGQMYFVAQCSLVCECPTETSVGVRDCHSLVGREVDDGIGTERCSSGEVSERERAVTWLQPACPSTARRCPHTCRRDSPISQARKALLRGPNISKSHKILRDCMSYCNLTLPRAVLVKRWSLRCGAVWKAHRVHQRKFSSRSRSRLSPRACTPTGDERLQIDQMRSLLRISPMPSAGGERAWTAPQTSMRRRCGCR